MNCWLKIKYLFYNYRPLSYYIIILLIFFLYPHSLVDSFFKTSLFKYFLHLYASFIYYSTGIVVNLLRINLTVAEKISNFNIQSVSTGNLSLWYTLLFITGTLFLQKNYKIKLTAIILGLLLIQLFNVGRILVLISAKYYFLSNYHIYVINKTFPFILNAAFVILIYYWFKSNYSLKRLFIEKLKLDKTYIKHLVKMFIICLLVILFINFIIDADFFSLKHYLLTGVLKASAYLLSHAGYNAVIAKHHFLKGNNVFVGIGFVCLGINLILLFSSLVIISGGKIIHQFLFIISGIIIIYGLNILRIVLLYIYLANRQNIGSFHTIHNAFTYIVYAIVFALWIIWFNKFWNKGKINSN